MTFNRFIILSFRFSLKFSNQAFESVIEVNYILNSPHTHTETVSSRKQQQTFRLKPIDMKGKTEKQ